MTTKIRISKEKIVQTFFLFIFILVAGFKVQSSHVIFLSCCKFCIFPEHFVTFFFFFLLTFQSNRFSQPERSNQFHLCRVSVECNKERVFRPKLNKHGENFHSLNFEFGENLIFSRFDRVFHGLVANDFSNSRSLIQSTPLN